MRAVGDAAMAADTMLSVRVVVGAFPPAAARKLVMDNILGESLQIGMHNSVHSYITVGADVGSLRRPGFVVRFPMCDTRITPSKSQAGRKRKTTASEDDLDGELKMVLVTLRDAIAKEEGSSMTAVFTVNQLTKMAKEKPLTPDDFANCEGVNERKFQQYHLRFLETIRGFLRAHGAVPLQLEETPKNRGSSSFFADANGAGPARTPAPFRTPLQTPTQAAPAPRSAAAPPRDAASARAASPAPHRPKPAPYVRKPADLQAGQHRQAGGRNQQQGGQNAPQGPRAAASLPSAPTFRGVTALHSVGRATTKKARKSNL